MAEAKSSVSSEFVQGVGGRLSSAKSPLYHEAVMAVEARANPFLARLMLATDIAYVIAAAEQGVTPAAQAGSLLEAILDLLARPEAELELAGGTGDIVLQREAWVIERVGRETGAWLHVGRNRGESVRNILPRLFFRDTLWAQRRALCDLVNALHAQAQENLHELAPVYHHLQHAGVTTVGEYLLSWAANLLPHFERLAEADRRLNVGPPPQTSRRQVVAINQSVNRRLRFEQSMLVRQQMHVAEDHYIEPFFCLTAISVLLSRLSQDLRIWMTTEFSLFDIDDSHASGSSYFPQKKNPFGLQAVIGGAAVTMGRLSAQIASAIAPSDEMDSVFNIGSLYQQSRDVVNWTRFIAEVVELGKFNRSELAAKATLGFAGAGEAIDILVFEAGVPLRTAHHHLGAFIRTEIAGEPVYDLKGEIERELGHPVGFDAAAVESIVRGAEVPATALADAAVDECWERVRDAIATEERALTAGSPVELIIASLTDEANTWLREH